MTKTTITEQINAIAFDTLTEEQFNFLKERALKSVRKSTGERKPTKRQIENDVIKTQILEMLGDGMTATQIGEALGVSVQRASALLKQMVDVEKVAKVKDGNVAALLKEVDEAKVLTLTDCSSSIRKKFVKKIAALSDDG